MPTATVSITPTTQTLVPYRSLTRPVTILHACTDHAPHAKMSPSSFAWLGHSTSAEFASQPSLRTPSAMKTARKLCQPYTTPATSVVMNRPYARSTHFASSSPIMFPPLRPPSVPNPPAPS